MENSWNNQLIYYLKLLKWNLKQHMQLLLRISKVSLRIFLRTIPDIHEYFQPIEDTIANKFKRAISGGRIVNDIERKLILLPTRYPQYQ